MAAAFVVALAAWDSPAAAATFSVNSTTDDVDAAVGNGSCAAINGLCTLRAAIQETNALAGADTINLPNGNFIISRTSPTDDDVSSVGDFDITDDLAINGSVSGRSSIVGIPLVRVFDIIGPATVTMTRVVIRDASLRNGEDGGGIRNDATLVLSEVTVSNNETTTGNGGGIANINGGTLLMSNCTVSGNRAPQRSGGGIVNVKNSGSAQDSTVSLNNVTIAKNSALSGGGIHNLGAVSMHNTLLAENSSGGNCAGIPPDSSGHNLDDGTTCVFQGPGDLTNADAMLGPLTDNGGFTSTHELLLGSAAIENGDNVECPSYDERGYPRPIDLDLNGTASCDIGAFEVQPIGTPTSTPTRTPTVPTPTITPTPSISPTSTRTLTPTLTATSTLSPSNTPSLTPSRTPTRTGTQPPTLTFTPTATPTRTQTSTRTSTITRTPSRTPSGQATATPTSTATPSPSSTSTPTTEVTSPPEETKMPTSSMPSTTPTATRTPTTTPVRPVLLLSTEMSQPGGEVTFTATLITQGIGIAGVQADIAYDSANIPIASNRGVPDCQINPAIGRVPFFAYQPNGCQLCSQVRALVFTLNSPVTGIPDGSILFSCRIEVAESAPAADYPLTIGGIVMSDTNGIRIPQATGSNGLIIVNPLPTATPTVTDTPSPTETPTDTPSPSPSVSPSQSPSPSPSPSPIPCTGDCKGGGSVTADELQTMINIALERTAILFCPLGDADHNGIVTIEEVVEGVNHAQTGCPVASATSSNN